MMEADNKKICPNCGGEMVGASCPYCHYVDQEYKASEEDTIRLGRKVIDEHFDVAYPEYFDKDFDLMAERTTYEFKYKYVLEVGSQKILIEATLINSLTDGQPSRYTTNISPTKVLHTIPPMAFLVDTTKFVSRDNHPILFKEWGLFCVGDIRMIQFSDKELRDTSISESAIKGLQMFTRAFYEAVIGDGTYTEELEELVRYNSHNSSLIQEKAEEKEKAKKEKDNRLSEREQKKKEEETERLWEQVRSKRQDIGSDIGMAYICIILSSIPLFAPLVYWIYNYGLGDTLFVNGICGGIALFAIILLYYSFSYLKRGLKRKEEFINDYPVFKDKDTSHFGVGLLIFFLIIVIAACGTALYNNVENREKVIMRQREEMIKYENDSIVANLIKREFVNHYKGMTYSNKTSYYSYEEPTEIKILDSEYLLFNGEKYPYTLSIGRNRIHESKTCILEFLDYKSEDLINAINEKVGENGYTISEDETSISFKPKITLKHNYNTIILSKK